MIMTKTTKIALSVMMAAAALSIIPQSTQAVPITGSISFNGSVQAYTGTTGSGPLAGDYSSAHSLVFSDTTVAGTGAAGHNGSFASPQVNNNDSVTMYGPLLVNPTALLNPANSPLWAVDGFTFTLLTLTEPTIVDPSVMILLGSGTISDGNPADSTLGNWTATFTSANNGISGATFSWNSSSSSTAPVPDAGASWLLLGLGLTALGAFAQFRKQVA